MADSITASFGMDTSPLVAAFAKAEQIAKTGGARVAQAIKAGEARAGAAMGGAGGVPWSASQAQAGFLARQRRNSAAGFAPAPAGKYASPAEQMGQGSGGYKGIAGLGRAFTAFVVVRKIIDDFQQANEEASKLQHTVNDITKRSGPAAFSGGSGIESNISEANKTLDEIRQRDLRENQVGMNPAERAAGYLLKKKRQLETGATDESDEAQRQSLRKQIGVDVGKLAEKQRDLNKAQQEEIFGSKEAAALAKEEIRNKEKLGELVELGKNGVNTKELTDQENARHAIEVSAIKQETALKMIGLNSEERLNAIAGESLTIEQKKLATIKERLEANAKEIEQSASDVPTQQKLLNDRGALLNEQRETQFGETRMSPDAVKARNASQLEANAHRAFNTSMGHAEDPVREAYGAVVSGIGKVGPQSQPQNFAADVFNGGGQMKDHPFVQAIKEVGKAVTNKLDEHLAPLPTDGPFSNL